MKKVLFATTAAGAMAVAGMASAQGITLFGDARLGLGYKVHNGGGFQDTEDDVRAISRVRFGVRMTGETTSGIAFGATIRADNAGNGQGGNPPDGAINNQRAGSVFVSGAYGTLTFGDTNSAHQQHVGDLPGVGLTGLGDNNEVPYFGNRRDGNLYRPTVRYDYEIAGFGVSLSTGSELDSIGVGASYTFDFGGGSVTAGAGYYDTSASTVFDPITEDEVERSGDQIAVGLSGEFAGFNASVIYSTGDDEGDDVDTLGAGIGTTFGAIGVNAFYHRFLEGGAGDDGEDDAYGVGMEYDLGGGARVVGGVARTFTQGSTGDNETVADFGISMAF